MNYRIDMTDQGMSAEKRGPGRPMIGGGMRERITITLDPAVRRALDGKIVNGSSRSWMVEAALRQMLGMTPPEKSNGHEDED